MMLNYYLLYYKAYFAFCAFFNRSISALVNQEVWWGFVFRVLNGIVDLQAHEIPSQKPTKTYLAFLELH